MSTRLFAGPFALVTVANFFFFLNFASFFLLPLYVKSLGGSEATVGLVMGTGGLAALIILPLIGSIIDRFGRRRFFVAGTIGMTLGSASFVTIDAIGPMMFALRVVQGFSFAAAFTASTTLAAELAPINRRAEALGIFGVSTLLTHALAPTIGEEIIHRFGFHTLFLTAASCSLVPLALLPRVPGRKSVHGEPAARFVRTPTPPLHLIVGAVMSLAGMGFGTVMTFVPTFVRAADLGRVSFFFGSYTTAAIATRLVGAGVSDSIGRRMVIIPALAALSLSILLLSQTYSVTGLIGAGVLFGLAQGMSYPTLHAFLVDTSPPGQLGRAQALFNGSFNLGVMSSAFLFGQIADRFGQRPMFAAASIMPIFASGVFAAFAKGPSARTPRSISTH
ncbi:MAG TPA: MFS transporter [Candidatus Acidoferrales bacterium]|nr:MFS transporter [Candidatus Acidoferrales bacterium]